MQRRDKNSINLHHTLYEPLFKGFPGVLLLVMPCITALEELLAALEVLLCGGIGTVTLGEAGTAGSIFFGSELLLSTGIRKEVITQPV